MSALRPLGHIAGNLQVLAILLVYRLRMSAQGQPHACWVDDDGCVYIAPTDHPRAAVMLRHAPEHRVNTYKKKPGVALPLTVFDMHNDLLEARLAYAGRSLHQAEAATA